MALYSPLKVSRLIVPHLQTEERGGLVTLYTPTISPYHHTTISPYHHTLIVASSEHDNIKLKGEKLLM